ncbi:RHS repeat-associated core domain-containing protein, partial [Chryseobacterium ureilyticum]
THSINHLGGYTRTESKLDFAAVPQIVVTKHKRLTTDTEKVITETFTYDHQNRLLVHKHKIDSNPEEILAQNDYNELSQLTTKKVGGISLGSPLQTINYQYNIRGWMTQINDPSSLNGKLFGYGIKYTNPVYTNASLGMFNGNISEIDWISFSDAILKRYNYQYDPLNRLLKGAYSEPNNSTPQNNYFNEELTYDGNGNIKTLKRFSKPVFGGATAEKIDDLIYNYQNGNLSNKLDKVTLPSGVANNFSGYNALQGTLEYDLNGNMTSHPDKKIKILYNYLNLPQYILVKGTIFDTSNTRYNYRADGTKISKIYDNNGLIEINYLDGFQYDNRRALGTSVSFYTIPTLKFVSTSEGYYNFDENKYIYNYVDHLGNVRLSYMKDDEGALKIIDENNYYPFGLKHNEGPILSVFGGTAYNYKYNGKELQETGMYDYGARMYMPDLGRWGVVDPRSQYTHEAYSYVWNNPIMFTDPTGMQGEQVSDWITNGKGSYKWDPNVTGPGNTPKGWKYVGPTGSYRINGATVQLLEEGKTFTNIDEVAVKGASPVTAGIVLSQNARFGLFAFLAVASWYVISDFVDTTPTQYGTRIDPMTYSPHTMNSESDSGDDKDVNGQDVPQEQKGDGNGKPTRNERMQQKKAKNGNQGNDGDNEYNQSAEHTNGARGSTKQKHQNGQARKNRDQGGEKGDRNRRRYK